MTLTDILLIAALAVFVLAWWLRSVPARRVVLIGSAGAAIAIAVAGVFTDRWQNGVGGVVALAFLGIVGAALLKNRASTEARTTGLPWVSGIAVTLLAAGAVGAIAAFPVWPLPKPSGEHIVGVRTFEIVDESRKGLLGAKPGEPRRLLVRVWYPAQQAAGNPAPYFTEAETKSTALTLGSFAGFPQFFTYVRHVRTNSHVDAPLISGASGLPVVFYSHGYTSFLHQNTVLMEHLASHGYVVFSIQHTYDSSATAFPNGDVAPMDSGMIDMATEEVRPTQKEAIGGTDLDKRLEGALAFQEYAVRAGDRIATKSTPAWVADRAFLRSTLLDAPPQQVADIAAASNLQQTGEMGMSFGGAIAGEICMIDTHCAAGINLDGGNFPFTAFNADIPVPFLMFHSELAGLYRQVGRPLPEGETARSFNEFSYERIADAGKREDVYRVQLKGAAHLGISDFTLFMAGPVRAPLLGGGPADVIVGAQNDFVLGFFDKHLRKTASDFPARQLADYSQWVQPVSNADLPAWWNAKSEAERAGIESCINALKPRYAMPPSPPQD